MFLPQMSPIWWMTLMIMFMFAMMISLNLMYFNYNKMFTNKKISHKNKMNWTW